MKRLLIIISIILLCSSFSFGAEDWIFKVPVKLKNICSDYKQVKVYCHAYVGPNYSSSNRLGGGWEGVYALPSTTSADVDGTVTVNAYRDPGKDPSQGTHYKCFLTGKWQSVSKILEDVKNDNPNCVYKPGTVFTGSFTGSL